MKAEYFNRPFRPKLSPGDMFVTGTGLYVVTKDYRLESDNHYGLNRIQKARINARSAGYVCIRIGGSKSPIISRYTAKMWQECGNYRILEKGEGIKITQECIENGGTMIYRPQDPDLFRRLRNEGPQHSGLECPDTGIYC